MENSLTYIATALAVTGCVALFQADARRAHLVFIQSSAAMQRASRLFGSVSLAVSMFAFGIANGFELGIPVWFGAVSAAGGAMLIINALKPSWLLPAAMGAIIVCFAGLGVSSMTGSA